VQENHGRDIPEKMARFLRKWNHYILWFVKNKPQDRDFI
jgi:hypothetical protein